MSDESNHLSESAESAAKDAAEAVNDPNAASEATAAAANAAEAKPKKQKSRAAKIAGIASCVLWIAGFALAFVIPPSSAHIWVPDTLLLVGFLPLLYLWRFSWPWLVFGLFNFFIGFVLLTIECIPDSAFPATLATAKQHIALYHKPFAWMEFGALTFIYGLIRMSKNIFFWWRAKAGKSV